MNRIEFAYAVLTITCTAWARIHHRRADRHADTTKGEQQCTDE